jgi:hypothetical protein
MEQPNNNTNPFSSSTPATTTTFSARRAALNPEFEAKLAQMSQQLAPLVQLTTGAVHPDFPRNLLAFWLLTDSQLESLAHFYHQRTPGPYTDQYPCPVSWPPGLTLEEKRRKLGKFIGLRGCDTPLAEIVGHEVGSMIARSEEEIREAARMGTENGGNSRRQRVSEEEEIRRKMGWY